MHECGITIVGKQYPGLTLFTIAEQVSLIRQLDLVGFLGKIGKSGITAGLDLCQAAVINGFAVGGNQFHCAGGFILFTFIHPCSVLLSVLTGQIHGGNGRSLHHIKAHSTAVRQHRFERVTALTILLDQRRHIHNFIYGCSFSAFSEREVKLRQISSLRQE